MILLQASICWSAGVASLVQSGPSWARDCARAGADHSAAATIAGIKIERRMTSPCIRLASQCFVAAAGLAVQVAHSQRWAEGVRTAAPPSAAHPSGPHPDEKRRDPEPDFPFLPSGRYGRIDLRPPRRQ